MRRCPIRDRQPLVIGQIAESVAGGKMSCLPEGLAEGKPVPEIGIGRIGDSGGGPDQKEEVKPEKKFYPWRGHSDSAP